MILLLWKTGIKISFLNTLDQIHCKPENSEMKNKTLLVSMVIINSCLLLLPGCRNNKLF
jgi:hypothetical protein